MDRQGATFSTPSSGEFSALPFRYRDLDLERPTFRLVRLFKGRSGDCLGCEIFHASFCERETSISYDALSYTWGNDASRCILYARGGQLEVTPNLYMALESLRSPSQDRVLWVDAICINQDSPGERQHQVEQMGRIYGNADTVLFWLGPSTSATNIALESLKRLQEESTMYNYRTWNRMDQRWDKLWSDLLPGLEDKYSKLLYHQTEGLRDLLSRSWFERVWILQEVANSKSALVCCGERCVSARIFTVAPRLFGVEPSPHCQAVLDIMPGPSRQDSWWREKPDLYTLLKKFRGSKASDPRDMIFALLGLASDAQADGFPSANYSQNEWDVVRELLCFLCSVGPLSAPVSADKEHWVHRALIDNAISVMEFLATLGLLSDTYNGVNSRLPEDSEKPPEASTNPAEHSRRLEVWDLLFRGLGKIKITGLLVEAVARSKGGKDVIELLLKRRSTEILITPQVIEAAMADEGGKDVMGLLLKRRRTEILITPQVIEAAMAYGEVKEVMELLLKECPNDILITPQVVEAAIADEAGKGVMKLLLKRYPNEILVTPQVVEAIMANEEGKEVIEHLLKERPSDILIAPQVVEAAMANHEGDGIMTLLLQAAGNGTTITWKAMEAAKQYRHLLALLDQDLPGLLSQDMRGLLEQDLSGLLRQYLPRLRDKGLPGLLDQELLELLDQDPSELENFYQVRERYVGITKVATEDALHNQDPSGL